MLPGSGVRRHQPRRSRLQPNHLANRPLDPAAATPQHVVVTVAPDFRNTIAGSKFRIYKDGQIVTDDRGAVDPSLGYSPTSSGISGSWYLTQFQGPQDFHTLWSESHILRIGTDGYGDDGYAPPARRNVHVLPV